MAVPHRSPREITSTTTVQLNTNRYERWRSRPRTNCPTYTRPGGAVEEVVTVINLPCYTTLTMYIKALGHIQATAIF